MARRFGVVSWMAMAVSVITGIDQILRFDLDLSGALATKVILVAIVIGLSFVHREIARNARPALRGAIEGMLLLVSLGILTAAVAA